MPPALGYDLNIGKSLPMAPATISGLSDIDESYFPQLGDQLPLFANPHQQSSEPLWRNPGFEGGIADAVPLFQAPII